MEVTNKGANTWDAQLRHREMVIQKGHTYSVSFKAHATRPTPCRAKVGMAGTALRRVLDRQHRPARRGRRPSSARSPWRRDDDATAEFALHMGGALAGDGPVPFYVCIDDVHLDDPQFVRKEAPQGGAVPKVLVNQVGYFPAPAQARDRQERVEDARDLAAAEQRRRTSSRRERRCRSASTQRRARPCTSPTSRRSSTGKRLHAQGRRRRRAIRSTSRPTSTRS